jgi:eukaryotic-like serine/threonine-protein kinase
MGETLPRDSLISHYRIISKLGEGGMAEVYLAQDTKLGRRVAMKFLPPQTTADQQARKRLIREAQAIANLEHQNICAIYEVGEADGHNFIVMQYVEGETLHNFVQEQSPDIQTVLALAVQIADALAEAHSRGIIHRDLKPQNIMITARRQAKVMDFGLAKVMDGEEVLGSEARTQSLLTTPGAVIGTIPYMSPEQVRGE